MINMYSGNIRVSNCKTNINRHENLTSRITISWEIKHSIVLKRWNNYTNNQQWDTRTETNFCTNRHTRWLEKVPSTISEYIFFSAAYRLFPKIENRVDHKSCLKSEINPCILLVQWNWKSMAKEAKESIHLWKLNDTLLNNNG